MCGIGGHYSFQKGGDTERLRAMSPALRERGPDGEGSWQRGPVALLHHRLALLDLSERGAQPMEHKPSGSVLCFNGEIYNFIELREELQARGEVFHSSGDTEVLLRGLVLDGMDFLLRADGDFAFAFWNEAEQTLYLARDRFGVKPLYLHRTSQELLFASNIRALLKAGVPKRIHPQALVEHLQYRYCEGEKTIFQGIERLKPGTYLKINSSGIQSHTYFSLEAELEKPRAKSHSSSALTAQALRQRLRADAPLGLLLSSGLDSNALAHLLTPENRLHTSTLTYDLGGQLSESQAARQLSSQLGMAHHVIAPHSLSLESARQLIGELEEPLGDRVIFAFGQLFQGAQRQVKAVLSGEGADEIWGGYAHHRSLARLFTLQSALRPRWRKTLARSISTIPDKILHHLLPYPADLQEHLGLRLQNMLQAENSWQAYNLSRSLFENSQLTRLLRPQFQAELPALNEPSPKWNEHRAYRSVLLHDLWNWLPNYGLLRTDKLSMRHGLEVRVPYLQHELVLTALNNNQRKSHFRRELGRKLKIKSLPRKKQPFFISQDSHLTPHFRAMEEHYLTQEKIESFELFNWTEVAKLLQRRKNFLSEKQLTSILHLTIWCDFTW